MSSGTMVSQRVQTRSGGRNISWLIFSVLTLIAMPAAIWTSLIYAKAATNLAGTEQIAQRIFYLHMGAVLGAGVAFLVALIGSILYLITRSLEWDRITQASVEVGIILGAALTLAGAIWAKPTWNTYWTWDPRLTTTTITLLIYIAYLLFRNGIDNRHTRARFSSIYALLAFSSVPLTYYSARWFRSIHPVVFNGQNQDAQGSFNIGVTMGHTLWVTMLSFCLLFITLMLFRRRQLRLEDRIEELREELY